MAAAESTIKALEQKAADLKSSGDSSVDAERQRSTDLEKHYEKQLTSLSKDLEESKGKLVAAESTNASLEQKIFDIGEELSQHRNKAAEAQSASGVELSVALAASADAKCELESLQTSFNEAQASKRVMESELKALRELVTAHGSPSELQQTIVRISDELSSNAKLLSGKEMEIVTWKSRAEEAEESCRSNSSQIDLLMLNMESLRSDCSDAKAAHASAVLELSEVQSRLDTDLEISLKELNRVKAELAEIQSKADIENMKSVSVSPMAVRTEKPEEIETCLSELQDLRSENVALAAQVRQLLLMQQGRVLTPGPTAKGKAKSSDRNVRYNTDKKEEVEVASLVIGDDTSDIRDRMVTFYQRNCPEKLGDVPRLLAKYQGKEAVMIDMLEKKYKASFPPDVPSTTTHMPQESSSFSSSSSSSATKAKATAEVAHALSQFPAHMTWLEANLRLFYLKNNPEKIHHVSEAQAILSRRICKSTQERTFFPLPLPTITTNRPFSSLLLLFLLIYFPLFSITHSLTWLRSYERFLCS